MKKFNAKSAVHVRTGDKKNPKKLFPKKKMSNRPHYRKNGKQINRCDIFKIYNNYIMPFSSLLIIHF